MIQRGNTIFKAIPIPEFDSKIVSLYVTFSQYGKKVLEKTLDDVDFDTLGTINNNVLIYLTQDEEAYSSQILIEQVGETINEEVI